MILVYQSLAMLLGIGLELVFGSPNRTIGLSAVLDRLIRLIEHIFYPEFPGQQALRRRGRLMAAVASGTLFAVSAVTLFYLYRFLPAAGLAFEGILFWQTLAIRRSWTSVARIADDLTAHDLYAARLHLSFLSNADTPRMTAAEITEHTRKAAHDDLTNGMIGPLFYFFYLGAPGAVLYLVILRLRSIHAAPDDRYRFFGIASVRLYDVIRVIPEFLARSLRTVSGRLLPRTRRSKPYANEVAQTVSESRLSLLLAVALSLLCKVPAILTLLLR